MLVLSRRAGQVISIGDNITVTVTDIGPRHVKLGIVAPNLPIVRDDAIRRNYRPGSMQTPADVAKRTRDQDDWMSP